MRRGRAATSVGEDDGTPVGMLLGARAADLPGVVRRFHASAGDVAGAGVLRVEQSATRIGRWMARRAGLPAMDGDVEVTVVVQRLGGGAGRSAAGPREEWRRSFGDDVLASAVTSDGRRLVEGVGRVEVCFDLDVADRRLRFRHVGTRVRFGRRRVPLPRWLAPRIDASVGAGAHGAQLDVAVRIVGPGLDPLLSYAGRLTPRQVA